MKSKVCFLFSVFQAPYEEKARAAKARYNEEVRVYRENRENLRRR